MSIHKSLKPKDKLKRQRNVLTRRERVEKLLEADQFDEEEDSVFGLPKLKKGRGAAIEAAAFTSADDSEPSSEDSEEKDEVSDSDEQN